MSPVTEFPGQGSVSTGSALARTEVSQLHLCFGPLPPIRCIDSPALHGAHSLDSRHAKVYFDLRRSPLESPTIYVPSHSGTILHVSARKSGDRARRRGNGRPRLAQDKTLKNHVSFPPAQRACRRTMSTWSRIGSAPSADEEGVCLHVFDDAGELLSLKAIRKQVIYRAVAHCAGNVSEAAKGLGVGRSTLHRWMREDGDDRSARGASVRSDHDAASSKHKRQSGASTAHTGSRGLAKKRKTAPPMARRLKDVLRTTDNDDDPETNLGRCKMENSSNERLG